MSIINIQNYGSVLTNANLVNINTTHYFLVMQLMKTIFQYCCSIPSRLTLRVMSTRQQSSSPSKTTMSWSLQRASLSSYRVLEWPMFQLFRTVLKLPFSVMKVTLSYHIIIYTTIYIWPIYSGNSSGVYRGCNT